MKWISRLILILIKTIKHNYNYTYGMFLNNDSSVC